MIKLNVMILCALFTISIYEQTGSSIIKVQKEINNTQINKQFVGVCYLDVQMKPGSDRFADAKFVPTFQDCNNCKKYPLIFDFYLNLTNSLTPCKIKGYIKDNKLICNSLDNKLEKAVQDSLMQKYNAKCKSK
jgi:hypothetical protein